MFWNKKDGEDSLPNLPQPKILENNIPKLESAPGQSDSDPINKSLPAFPDSPMNKGFSQTAIKEAVTTPEGLGLSTTNQPDASQRQFKTVQLDDKTSNQEIRPSISSIASAKKAPEKIESKPAAKPSDFTSENLYSPTIPIKPSAPVAPVASTQISRETAHSQAHEEFRPSQFTPKTVVKEEKIQSMPAYNPPAYNPPAYNPPAYVPPVKQYQKPKEEREYEEFTPRPIAKKPQETKTQNVFVKIDRFYSAKKALDSAKQQLNDIEELLKKIREVKLREEQELDSWEKELLHAKSYVQEVNDNIFDKIE